MKKKKKGSSFKELDKIMKRAISMGQKHNERAMACLERIRKLGN